jgi:hypothetical protein
MLEMKILYCCLVVSIFFGVQVPGQDTRYPPITTAYQDSLEKRAHTLRNKIPRLKENRDPSYYYLKTELDHTLFEIYYTECYKSEELDNARDLIEKRLKDAEFRKDDLSLTYYNYCKDRVYYDIKLQKMRYHELFNKERNFKRTYKKIIRDETLASYKKAESMTKLAIKYANEQNLEETIEYLEDYLGYTQAMIFDESTEYDLSKLTHSERHFEDVFMNLVNSDSLAHIQEAKRIVDQCLKYASNSRSLLTPDYFEMQKKVVVSALSDYYERDGNIHAGNMGNQVVNGSVENMNPPGVYKWGENILVIGFVELSSRFENVNRGEAIIAADKKLLEYIKVNKLGKIKKSVKMGSTYIIPYVIKGAKEDFYFDPANQVWQYMVCYTMIVNNYFTDQVSQYLAPITFQTDKKSDDMAENLN